MGKLEYFINALRTQAFTKKEWVIKCFSEFTQDAEEPTIIQLYPYYLRQQGRSLTYWLEGTWYTIDDYTSGPLFSFQDEVVLMPGDIDNITYKTETTVGLLFVNAAVLCYAFGDKIGYQNDSPFSANHIARLIEPLLTDDVASGESEDPKRIYVREYKHFGQAMYQLAGYSALCVPGATPRSITRNPEAIKLKAQLIAENKDRLNDPAVIARIEQAIVALDREWINGDEAKNFYIKDKAITNSRKRQHYMVGLEKGLGSTPVLVDGALADGIDYTKLPAYCNQSREGSHSRGSETQLGGVVAKETLRATQNASITEKDCGATIGFPFELRADNANMFIGFSHIVATRGSDVRIEDITEDNIKLLIGRKINLRSPMLCKTTRTDYCEVCMGRINSLSPDGLNALSAEVGSTFLGAFMARMHNTTVTLRRYRPSISIQ